MKSVLPLVLFLIIFYYFDVFFAIGFMIIYYFCFLIFVRLRTGAFDTKVLVYFLLFLFFGGMSIIFKNDIFIKWKVSILYWIVAVLFFLSKFFNHTLLYKYFLNHKMRIPFATLTYLCHSFFVFFIFMGFLNLYVAYNFSTKFWFFFKIFGFSFITFFFIFFQFVFVFKDIEFFDKDI